MDLPHHLDGPLEIEAFPDDLSEQLLCLLFCLVQDEGVPDVVSVFHTRQFRDPGGSHLVSEGVREGGREGSLYAHIHNY